MWDLSSFKDNTALLDDTGRSLSYGELEVEANKLFSAVSSRCLVFSLCENTIGSVVGYVSFINNRVVPVLLNARADISLVRELIDIYSPAFIWLPDDIAAEFPGFDFVYGAFGYSLLGTGFTAEHDLFPDLGLLLTTSGSTGSPKFVRQSYDNIRANIDSIVDYLHIDSDERPITTLPMNYTYGLSVINTHLDAGATILLTEHSLIRKEFWRFFREQGATSISGVPYTYEILDKMRFIRMELPSLRTLTQAGGKLRKELHAEFAEYAEASGKEFVVMYGQCEATARMGYLPPSESLNKIGSMGIAIPGGSFSLEDADGNFIIEPYTTGELIYSGKNVTLGYAECVQDLAKGDERHGVLHTGDMAQFDDDGYYYIVGRKKRFLKLYGNRVNLDEVEQLIKSEFSGADCACGGVDDHLVIFITDPAVADAVRSFASHKTGINPAAFRTVVLDTIPKNDAGKTLYSVLQKEYSAE